MIKIININRYITLSVFSVISVFLTGCISPPNIKYTHGQTFDLLTTTSAESSIVILDKDNTVVFCSEPASDVLINTNESLSLSADIEGATDSTSDSIGDKESALSNITGNLLLTREILYRACEFISNSDLSEKQKLDVFLKALELVATVNRA